MKKIALILTVFLSISCKAQNIVPLDSKRHKTPDNSYFKDLNGELNKFVGTWKMIVNDTILTIVIEKKEKVLINNRYFDMLEGEYSYIVNGEEVVNTLPNLNLNDNEKNMGGGYISKPNQRPKCDDCAPDERRVEMYFVDPEREYLSNSLVLRFIPGVGANPPQIIATLYQVHGVILPDEDSPIEPRVPYGEYLLEKQ